MDRRNFLKTVSAAGLTVAAFAERGETEVPDESIQPATKTWHFWDLWHFDRMSNLVHRQGQPTWRREGTFVDPLMYGHNSWPTVYLDRKTGMWRMLYSISWKPYRLMVAESKDGIRWKPSAQPAIKPSGEKQAPHHIFTLEHGSAGGVYLDPVAADGFPFKVYAHENGEPVFRRALADTRHRWHKIAKAEGVKRYMNDELTLISRDGLNWQADRAMNWGMPDWHPEPPIFGFYHRAKKQHAMTVRPGWGDRRVCLQTSNNFKNWSGPELLFQPDVLDDALIQHYGMPVFPYAGGYIGLLWIFHCSDSGLLVSFNQFQGPLDVQLAYSYDGDRFFRGKREAFIPVNPLGEHGSGGIQSCSMVETDNEIRIYSGAGKVLHGLSGSTKNGRKRGLFSILLHTLRKDGFTFLESKGDWGEFLSKPLTLSRGQLTMNAKAPFGEVRFQITDLKSRPVEGFTFEDCIPLKEDDKIAFPIRWKAGKLQDVVGKVIRLEVQLRNAQLHAFHGRFHFIDAQDLWMLDDGKSIDISMFDF